MSRSAHHLTAEVLRPLVFEHLQELAKNKQPRPSTQWVTLKANVESLAATRGLVQQRRGFHEMEADALAEVVWELIGLGIIHPTNNEGWPFLVVSSWGQQALLSDDPTPYDRDGYLRRLESRCPGLDSTTRLYVAEALASFQARNHVATVVMVGVAAESALHPLADALIRFRPKQEAGVQTARKGRNTDLFAQDLFQRIKSVAGEGPENMALKEMVGRYDPRDVDKLIRGYRNEAGHPSGRRFNDGTPQVLLGLLQIYLELVFSMTTWMNDQAAGG